MGRLGHMGRMFETTMGHRLSVDLICELIRARSRDAATGGGVLNCGEANFW
jgi:hypothetical protein